MERIVCFLSGSLTGLLLLGPRPPSVVPYGKDGDGSGIEIERAEWDEVCEGKE